MEELDIPGALERLKPYDLSPIERVLAGHTGTVQLLLSLLFGEPVDVVLIGQFELIYPRRPSVRVIKISHWLHTVISMLNPIIS